MRVGIDARLLSKPLAGIGRYTLGFTVELLKQPAEFFLYSPSEITIGAWSQQNVHLRTGSCKSRLTGVLWSQLSLPRLLRQDGIDVFWGASHRIPHFIPDQVARVVTVHDLVWKFAGETMNPPNRWLEKHLMPDAIKLADRIVTDSQSTMSDLLDEFPQASDRVSVVYPGVSELPEPLDLGTLRFLEGFDPQRPYFLFVGTLEPRKNLGRLLWAFAELDDSLRDNVQMVIVGAKGWGGVDIERLISEHRLQNRVVVTGFVDNEQLATLYAHARFLAMPSIYEGFGLPLLEAMSLGAPVLSSSRSSMPEVVGDAGILVDPMDHRSIAQGLHRLLDDDRYRAQLAAKARANAARFSWVDAAQTLFEVFKDAIRIRSQLGSGREH